VIPILLLRIVAEQVELLLVQPLGAELLEQFGDLLDGVAVADRSTT
jgi:hypothetical protein